MSSVMNIAPTNVLLRQQTGAILVDVREDAYFRRGHLPGAINISVNRIRRLSAMQLPDKEQEIICYCNGGTRGLRAAEALVEIGYRHVGVLEGGLREYMAQFGD